MMCLLPFYITHSRNSREETGNTECIFPIVGYIYQIETSTPYLVSGLHIVLIQKLLHKAKRSLQSCLMQAVIREI